jgi:hypothetical protein
MNASAKQTLVPALLAGAAVYFGFKGKGNVLGDITKEALNRVINDTVENRETPAQEKTQPKPPTLKAPRNRKKKKPSTIAKEYSA